MAGPRGRRERPAAHRAPHRPRRGRTWTDQQWLAQVVFYAAHELAGMRAVILLGIALVLLALALVIRDREDERRLVALDVPRSASSRSSPARGAGRCARRQLRFHSTPGRCGSCRRVASWRPQEDAARAAATRGVGEPPRLGRPRRGPDHASRRGRDGAHPHGSRGSLLRSSCSHPLRARLTVRDEARRLLRPDAGRRPVRGHAARVAVVEPERDDGALLAPRDPHGRLAGDAPLPRPPHVL